MSVKLLDGKVSYTQSERHLQVVILGKIERWKEGLLTAWLLAWIFCGVVVMMEYGTATDREFRMGLLIFLVFWVYYLWRVGRTWLYRLGGNELIKVENGQLILKRSFFTYGKSKTFYLENIVEFEPVELSKTSIAYTYENGWWVLGGEKLGFMYQGRFVKFAMQISPDTREKLYRLLQKQMFKELKNRP